MSQQCANAVLGEKSSLRIVSCNIALIQSLNVSSGYFYVPLNLVITVPTDIILMKFVIQLL